VKILWGHKDGGPDSNVRCWGFEAKGLCSVLLLCFGEGSREAYHSHAFNAVSWLLRGRLLEHAPGFYARRAADSSRGTSAEWRFWYRPSLTAIRTARHWFHKVEGLHVRNWVLTFRGPWVETWKDGQPQAANTLTHGRNVVDRDMGSRSND
jgi:hypothetical protein